MKIKFVLLGLMFYSLNLFAIIQENKITAHANENEKVSSYPKPEHIYFKDVQDDTTWEFTSLSTVTLDDLKKHNKLLAKGKGYNYKIIKFRMTIDVNNDLRTQKTYDLDCDSLGTNILSQLEKNKIYVMRIENMTVIAPDSKRINFQSYFVTCIFPDSTYLMADRYYPQGNLPRKAKHNIRIALEGDVSQEDRDVLKKIVADYNSVLSTIKVKIVKHFPTIQIILNKKNESPSSVFANVTPRSNFFFPELKTFSSGKLNSVEGLKNSQNQYQLYNEINNALNSFDKNCGYSKSNIIGDSYKHFNKDNISDEIRSKLKEMGIRENELLDVKIKSENELENPGLTHEDKMALKIMFSPGYDKIISKIYSINKEPISTYFLLVIIFSIIVFIMGYELLAYLNIERYIHSKFIRNSLAMLLFVQSVIVGMYWFLPFHPEYLDPLWKYNIYFSIYAILCTWLFFGSDLLQNKIKTNFLQLVANPIITLVVLYLAYQIIYLFVTGERLQFQTIDQYALIIGLTIVAVRFYLFYEHSKIVSLMQEKEYELTRQKELKNRAELNALQARINPHFLYNALNSIASLAHTSAERTEKMALSLSKLFRYNVNRESELTTSLGEELEMVQLYLEIEKQRFGERLNFSIETDKQLYEKQIPRFLIQPLVENAIKHGISKIKGEGIIKLKIYSKEKGFCIEIHDNGPAFPINDLVNGYGLQNTYDKLNLVYKKPYDLKFVNNDGKYLLIYLS